MDFFRLFCCITALAGTGTTSNSFTEPILIKSSLLSIPADCTILRCCNFNLLCLIYERAGCCLPCRPSQFDRRDGTYRCHSPDCCSCQRGLVWFYMGRQYARQPIVCWLVDRCRCKEGIDFFSLGNVGDRLSVTLVQWLTKSSTNAYPSPYAGAEYTYLKGTGTNKTHCELSSKIALHWLDLEDSKDSN